MPALFPESLLFGLLQRLASRTGSFGKSNPYGGPSRIPAGLTIMDLENALEPVLEHLQEHDGVGRELHRKLDAILVALGLQHHLVDPALASKAVPGGISAKAAADELDGSLTVAVRAKKLVATSSILKSKGGARPSTVAGFLGLGAGSARVGVEPVTNGPPPPAASPPQADHDSSTKAAAAVDDARGAAGDLAVAGGALAAVDLGLVIEAVSLPATLEEAVLVSADGSARVPPRGAGAGSPVSDEAAAAADADAEHAAAAAAHADATSTAASQAPVELSSEPVVQGDPAIFVATASTSAMISPDPTRPPGTGDLKLEPHAGERRIF